MRKEETILWAAAERTLSKCLKKYIFIVVWALAKVPCGSVILIHSFEDKDKNYTLAIPTLLFICLFSLLPSGCQYSGLYNFNSSHDNFMPGCNETQQNPG